MASWQYNFDATDPSDKDVMKMAGKTRQVEILQHLYEQEKPTTAKYLADEFGIEVKSMYEPLKKLRKNGLIKRLNTEVVNNIPYGLTKEGEEMIERIQDMNLIIEKLD